MREIQLKGKSYANTRQMVDALAWATNRRGRVAWKHDYNVCTVIWKYLEAHNVDLPAAYKGHGESSGRIRHTMDRLVAEGYAEVTMSARGTVLSFKFKDDVDLNGHMPRFVTPAVASRLATPPPQHAVSIPDLDPDDLLPPLPKPDRFKKAQIDEVLDLWAEANPDAYADWAEKLIERLGATLHAGS